MALPVAAISPLPRLHPPPKPLLRPLQQHQPPRPLPLAMQQKPLTVPQLAPLPALPLAQLQVPPLVPPLVLTQRRTHQRIRPWTPPKTRWAMPRTKPWKSPKARLLAQLLAPRKAVPQVLLPAQKRALWTQ